MPANRSSAISPSRCVVAVSPVAPRGTGSGSLPVACREEFDVQCAQVLPSEVVKRRELVLAARVVQPPDGQPAALSVDQPEEPSGVQCLGYVTSDSVVRPGLA